MSLRSFAAVNTAYAKGKTNTKLNGGREVLLLTATVLTRNTNPRKKEMNTNADT